MSYQLFSV